MNCDLVEKRSVNTPNTSMKYVTLRLKCNGTRAETRFRLSAKRTSPFKSAGALVQSTTGSRVLRISGSTFPCFTVCHHISTGLYLILLLMLLFLLFS